MNLYELAKEIKTLERQLDENENQENQEEFLAAQLAAVELDFERKASGLTRWILNLESDAESLAVEIKRLQAMKKAKENRAQSLREWLKFNLKHLGQKSFDAGVAKLSLKQTQERYELKDTAEQDCLLWPEEVFEKCCEQHIQIRKMELKGFPREQVLALPGVELVPQGWSLQIR